MSKTQLDDAVKLQKIAKDSGINLKASEVLEFRDQAFMKYFNNSDYLSMIKTKFGESTRAHIVQMSQHKLKRRHQFEKVSY